MSMSLDDFAKDCFTLDKLLTIEEVEFILQKSEENILSQQALDLCLQRCMESDQESIIEEMSEFMWRGKVKSGSYKISGCSVFLTLDFQLTLYKMENNVLKEFLGSFNLKDSEVTFDYKNHTINIGVVEKGILWNTKHSLQMTTTNQSLSQSEDQYVQLVTLLGMTELLSQRGKSHNSMRTDLSISENSAVSDDERRNSEQMTPVNEQEVD